MLHYLEIHEVFPQNSAPRERRGRPVQGSALLLLGVRCSRFGRAAAVATVVGRVEQAGKTEGRPQLHPCCPSSSWAFGTFACPVWHQVAALLQAPQRHEG